jgi:hypothetical protein
MHGCVDPIGFVILDIVICDLFVICHTAPVLFLNRGIVIFFHLLNFQASQLPSFPLLPPTKAFI